MEVASGIQFMTESNHPTKTSTDFTTGRTTPNQISGRTTSKSGKTWTVISPVTGKTLRYGTNAKDRSNVYSVRHLDDETRTDIDFCAASYGSVAAGLKAAARLEYVRTKLRDYQRRPPRTESGQQEQSRLQAEWDSALTPGGALSE